MTSAITGEEARGASARRAWPVWATVFIFWTFFGFLNANQVYLEMLHDPRMHHSWWRIVAWQVLVWNVWALLTPLILGLGRRYPLEGRFWLRGLLAHLPVAVILSAVHLAAATWLRMAIEPFDVWSDLRPFLAQYQGELRGSFLFDFLIYWAILSLGYAFDYHERYRERETHASRLETQLAQAQLESLKMQLHPHFLFNTLHAIAGLVRSHQSKPAVEMIVGLSDLLRHALESASEQEVTLREEIRFLEIYLEIQKVRFSDRLTVGMNIAPETLDALVPNLILQPLVENAFRHGIALRESGGVITVNAALQDGMLRLSVCDDGPGLQAGWRLEESSGIGLANTRQRLMHLYGPQHEFDLKNGASGGVTVSLAVPFRHGSQYSFGR